MMTGASAAVLMAQTPGGQPAAPPRPAMTLTTTAFPDGDPIPAKYTQAGEQVSPALNWGNVPPGTQSFVLHMHDPDVARNKTTEDQVHWLVWNIPGTATGLPENVPKGAELPDGMRQISASGPVYRGPGAPANGRCTTTPSKSTPSTQRSTSPPAPTPGKRAPPSGRRCKATSWGRPSTSGCSDGHSSWVHLCTCPYNVPVLRLSTR